MHWFSGDVQMLLIATAIQRTLELLTVDPSRLWDSGSNVVVRTTPAADLDHEQGQDHPLKLLLVPTKPTSDVRTARYSHYAPLVAKQPRLPSDHCGARYFNLCIKPSSSDGRPPTKRTCVECDTEYHEECVESDGKPFNCGCTHMQPRSFKW